MAGSPWWIKAAYHTVAVFPSCQTGEIVRVLQGWNFSTIILSPLIKARLLVFLVTMLVRLLVFQTTVELGSRRHGTGMILNAKFCSYHNSAVSLK